MSYIDSNKIDLMSTNKTTVISYLVHLQNEGRATSTISRNLASIRSFYQYLVRMKQVEDNPTTGLESPKLEKKLPTVLSVNEINLLLSSMPKGTVKNNALTKKLKDLIEGMNEVPKDVYETLEKEMSQLDSE